MGVIIDYILPMLDRVSQNRLSSTYKELYAASRKVDQQWPFTRRGLLQAHEGADDVRSVAFSPDSALLATSGGDDGIISIWNRADGQCTHLEGDGYTVYDLCFSPDGKLLASAGEETIIRLWKLDDWSYRGLEGHTSDVMTVAFSRDGTFFVSGEARGAIRLWHVNDGRCIRVLVDESIDCIQSVTFAPDGDTIASAGYRMDPETEHFATSAIGAIVLWDISDANHFSSTTIRDTYDGVVTSLEYSPDGRYFATGFESGTIRLWNAADKISAILMTGNGHSVYSVAFSPNGRILASANSDGSVQLLRVEDGDGSCLVNLSQHHVGGFMCVAFSPDGLRLASCGTDGTVCLWNPHEEDRKQFTQVDWEKVFLLWNFRQE